MKTSQTIEDRQSESEVLPDLVRLDRLAGRQPRQALSLSIVPGLGQLYNGEALKGILFLGASLANLILISLLFFTEPMLNGLLHFASTCFHVAPRLEVHQILEIVQTGRSVTLVYLGLVLIYALYAGRDAYDRACEKHRGKTLPRIALTMPEATSGSYILHFSIISAFVLLVIFFCAPPKPPQQITDIELTQENKPPPPKKVEPPKPEEKPKQELKKEPTLKQPEPKMTPVAIAVPTDKPVADPVVQSSQPAPEQAPVASNSSNTGSSSGQQASGDGDDVDFGNYLAEIQKRIKKNWYPPRGAESLTLTLKFKVLKDGSLATIKLVRSTGVSAADDAAKAAITGSAPFPPLPKGAGDDIDIKFTFDYNVFNGKLPVQQ